MNKKILCYHPFYSINIFSNWDVSFCCKMSNPIWNLKNDSLENILNSNIAFSIRESILNWIFHKSCKKCLIEKKIWFKDNYLETSKLIHYDLISKSIDKLKVNLKDIQYISISFSNLCNFSCIMCSSDRSILRRKYDEIVWEKVYWYENISKYIREIKKLINIKEIYVIWWEPMIERLHFEFLENYIKKWVSKNISLEYSTNLSILPWIDWYEKLLPKWFKNIFELWKEFKKIVVFPSCDWTKENYEKIRQWWKYEQFMKNLDILIENKIEVSVRITVQIDNIYNLPVLINYLSKRKINYNIWFVKTPKYLSIVNIPKEEKIKIEKFYEKIIQTNKFDDKWIMNLRTVIEFMRLKYDWF